MKSLFKWLVRLAITLVLLVIVLLVGFVVLKDPVVKAIAEHNLRAETGMDARISKLEVNFGSPTVNLEGLKLYNPPEFGGSTFIDLPELRVEYATDDIMDRKLHFKTLRINLAEVHIVKNKQGKTNLEMLEENGKAKKRDAEKRKKTDSPGVDFGGVDTLYLTIGRIRITDESDPRNNEVIELGIKDEVGKNLKNEEDMRQWFSGVLLRLAIREWASGSRSNNRDQWQKLLRVFGVKV
jgi:uncharacterized protein involved in outer membrane biogenesis